MKHKLAISAAAVLIASTAILGFNGGQITPKGSQGVKTYKQGTSYAKSQTACNCPMMAQMSGEHMKKSHETGARLDSLVSEMDSNSGTRKTDATSSIVKLLVNERNAMHQTMMAHHKTIIADTKGGACNCPMMKPMTNAETKDMHDAQAHLDSLVNEMDSNSGVRKTDATASIVKMLVEERAKMHKKMMAGY